MASKRRQPFAAGSDGAPPHPEKRPRVAAEAAPGSSRNEPSPSRKHFLSIVLVVLFLKRPEGRNTGSVPVSPSLIGRLVTELGHVRQCLNTIIRRQDSIKKSIQALTQKVDNISGSSSKHLNHDRPMKEPNQEGTSAQADGLDSNGREGKSGSFRLCFLNEMKTPIYHDDEIKSQNNTAINIGIFKGDKMIESGELSNLRIEAFALEGDFPYDTQKSWTAKEFNEHIALGRDGGDVLAGEGRTVQLINGKCDLGSIRFREGSCRARKQKFILGARVCDGQAIGVRVQEAVMKPVVVQDRRNKANEKSHPPKLKDEVHCLEEIGKGGQYCNRLEKAGIFTVEDFLKALNKDPDNLASILKINKKYKAWEKMTKHARECSLEGRHKLKSFFCTEKNVKLFFNCVHCLVGAEFFGGCYTPADRFSTAEQVVVDELREGAYSKLDVLPEDHVMIENSPNPIRVDVYTLVGPGSSYVSGSTHPNCSGRLAADQVGGTEIVKGSNHARIGSSCANTHSGPGPSSSTPDHHSIHNHQVGPIPVAANEDLSRAQTQIGSFCASANNDPSPSSLVSDHLSTYIYHEQGTLFAGQEDLSSAFLIDTHQYTFGGRNFSFGTAGASNICQFAPHDGMVFLLDNCVAPGRGGLGQEEIQRELFCSGKDTFQASTSAPHLNMTLIPQQLTIPGTPGSAPGSMQNQMQGPLTLSNGASVATASPRQALPPQQWSPWNGSF